MNKEIEYLGNCVSCGTSINLKDGLIYLNENFDNGLDRDILKFLKQRYIVCSKKCANEYAESIRNEVSDNDYKELLSNIDKIKE